MVISNTKMEIKKCFYSIIQLYKICIYLQVTYRVVVAVCFCRIQSSHLTGKYHMWRLVTRKKGWVLGCLQNTPTKQSVLFSAPSLFISPSSYVLSFEPHTVSHNFYSLSHSVPILRYVVWLHRKWSHILQISCLSSYITGSRWMSVHAGVGGGEV